MSTLEHSDSNLVGGDSVDDPLLTLDSLHVEYATKTGPLRVIRDVSLQIQRGETFGLAGESGSGKSTLAHSVLRYLGDNGNVTEGSIQFDGDELLDISKAELRNIRGNRVAHVAQSPDKALNPSMEVGEQIAETIRLHQDVTDEEAWEQTIDVLKNVNLPDPKYNANRYPHELSGGMQQRILIAMALSCNPELLILDEPTTGLDVTTEAKILDLVEELKTGYNTSILLITHDLGVIAQIADRTAIMYAGEIMERGPVEEVFQNPANPYTRGLLDAVPEIGSETSVDSIPGNPADLHNISNGCTFADRCEYAEPECETGDIREESVSEDHSHSSQCRRWEAVQKDTEDTSEVTTPTDDADAGDILLDGENVRRYFGEKTFFDKIFGGDPPIRAVDGVDFDVRESETLGLVGESGCGKSTLAKTVLRLLDLTDGSLTFDGEEIGTVDEGDLHDFRSEAQIVFQHPDSSLNPRKTVRESLTRPLENFTNFGKEERSERIDTLLEQVELGTEYADRYPHELSGGEKQRVAIARAFAANPSFVVLDEPLSALDVSVQASILNLLSSLRREYGASFLFISHDLSVVNHISDRIAVMYLGEIVEVGSRDAVFEPPYHPYTQALLSSVPSKNPEAEADRIHLEGDVPSPRDAPSGCPFHTRCPKKIGEICENEHPELEDVESSDDDRHAIACHLDESEMATDVTETEHSE